MRMRTVECAPLTDAALLALRLATGGLLAGHGAQKLFGWFGGHGFAGTAQWLESMGLRPGKWWAAGAGLAEFGGGMLTALGLFNPLGPIGITAAMGAATAKVHWGKPIWVTEGGAEFPLTNAAVALAIALAGPGRYSLDRVFGIRLPWAFAALAAAGAAAGLALAVGRQPAPAAETEPRDEAAAEEQAERDRARFEAVEHRAA